MDELQAQVVGRYRIVLVYDGPDQGYRLGVSERRSWFSRRVLRLAEWSYPNHLQRHWPSKAEALLHFDFMVEAATLLSLGR